MSVERVGVSFEPKLLNKFDILIKKKRLYKSIGGAARFGKKRDY